MVNSFCTGSPTMLLSVYSESMLCAGVLIKADKAWLSACGVCFQYATT